MKKTRFLIVLLGAAVLATSCVPEDSSKQGGLLAAPKPVQTADATPTDTATPTASPTASPSPSPSASPSPTAEPTATEVAVATTAPTQRPTTAPTRAPTAPPTVAPTPTPVPTPVPNVPPVPPATSLGAYGKVTDAATGLPLANVCVTIGIPGAICWARTNGAGNYAIDMVNPWAASPGQFEAYFILSGYVTAHSPAQYIGSVVRIDFAMHR